MKELKFLIEETNVCCEIDGKKAVFKELDSKEECEKLLDILLGKITGLENINLKEIIENKNNKEEEIDVEGLLGIVKALPKTPQNRALEVALLLMKRKTTKNKKK